MCWLLKRRPRRTTKDELDVDAGFSLNLTAEGIRSVPGWDVSTLSAVSAHAADTATDTTRRFAVPSDVMGPQHPLDIDLLDHCLAAVDCVLPYGIEAHLPMCLLCRIRLNRIRRSNPRPADPPAGVACEVVAPGIAAALAAGSASQAVAAGQVWLAGEGDRVLVWIRSVCGSAVTVHPVTFDIAAIDDTGLIFDDFAEIGHPVAIVVSVVGTIQVASLAACLGDLPDLLGWVAGAVASDVPSGLATGAPISGPTDERIEFRQILADEIASLDPLN